jgi:putative endonuclease
MYYTYFIESQRNYKVYVGYTNKKPLERLKDHNSGKNKYTNNNKPFKLLYYEEFNCKQDAMLKEKFYKTGFGKRIKKAIISEVAGR